MSFCAICMLKSLLSATSFTFSVFQGNTAKCRLLNGRKYNLGKASNARLDRLDRSSSFLSRNCRVPRKLSSLAFYATSSATASLLFARLGSGKMVQLRTAMSRNVLQAPSRYASTITPIARAKRRKVVDETSIAGAQHKASMSGPSLGYLISELSATRPGMESLRREGQTMSEEHRTQARQVVKWLAAIPLALGAVVVGLNVRND